MPSFTDTPFPQDIVNHSFKGGMFHCKDLHHGTCEWNTFKWFFIVFKNAFKFYGAIHLLPVIIFKLKRLGKDPWGVVRSYLKNVAKSCLFLSTYMALLRYGLCLYRNMFGQNRPLNVILAGLGTFPGMFLEAEGRRTEMSLYFLSPFVEGVWLWFKKRGLVSPIKNGDVYLFSFTMAIIMYCYQNEQSAIKQTYLALCKKLWGEN